MGPKRRARTTADRLEDFEVRAHPYGRLTGLSMAAHAVPDCVLLLHAGVGCKKKGSGQLEAHDLARVCHHREGHTEIDELHLVRGSAERLGIYIRDWNKKRKPALIAVSSATFLEMTGEDFGAAVRRARGTVDCEVAYIRGTGFTGDLYEGYAAFLEALGGRIPFRKVKPVPGKTGILGYLFDRYEMDHAGNLSQLAHLLRSLGLEPGPVLLSGRPYGELLEAASCSTLLCLPYASGLGSRLRPGKGRKVVETGLPVGIQGTYRWLDAAGKAAGVSAAVIRRAAAREKAFSAPQFEIFRRFARQRLRGGRGAVFADAPLAAGLASLLVELDLPPVLVGLRGRSLGGETAFRRAAAGIGVELPADLKVLEEPSLDRVSRELSALLRSGSLAAVLGSTAELGRLASCAGGDHPGLARVEIGFPALHHHALYPSPYYGIGGALLLAQRIMNSSLSGVDCSDYLMGYFG